MPALRQKPRLAVWKFASCDGCQLSLLDLETELLKIAGEVDIAYFPEMTRDEKPPPYDLSLVEGSITTAHDARRIEEIRQMSAMLITIGACAIAGGIQALRNFGRVAEFSSVVYAHPEFLDTLDRSTPISHHVQVDFELRGCPVNKYLLLELVNAYLNHRQPNINPASVCLECKQRGNPCVMVANGIPCMGPVTQAGCGAICPAYQRGCYACFGPAEDPNTSALSDWWITEMEVDQSDVRRAFRTFNPWTESFREEGDRHEF